MPTSSPDSPSTSPAASDFGGTTMPIAKKYLFIVSMDVQKDKEALFNEVYDKEHVPLIQNVPAAFNIGGEKKVLDGAGMAHYVAFYELDSPDVLLSKEWAAAGEKGRW